MPWRSRISLIMSDSAARILEELVQNRGFCSGEELSGALGISRSAVWKHISQLRRDGYGIEAVKGKGYRLQVSPGYPDALETGRFLHTSTLGCRIEHHRSVMSTNAQARKLAREGAPEGLVVTADAQTGGRGRMQRVWHSPPGVNLYFSIVLRPPVPPRVVPQIPLLAAAALHTALASVAGGVDLRIKWPNDILAGGRKLCGVLCEMESEADMTHVVIVGIGVNVNLRDLPPEIEGLATSLLLEAGYEFSRPELLALILNDFEPLYRRWLEVRDLSPVLGYLEEHSWLRGKQVEVDQYGRRLKGVAAGISPTGELLLDMPDGSQTMVSSGETHLIPDNERT